MKTSARNHFLGTVTVVKPGAVNDEIILRVGEAEIVAILTRESTQALGLAVGKSAVALIKASSVMIMLDAQASKISARNVLTGTITGVHAGSVNTDVTIAASGLTVTAIITNDSARRLALAVGQAASAVFKASSVIVAVE